MQIIDEKLEPMIRYKWDDGSEKARHIGHLNYVQSFNTRQLNYVRSFSTHHIFLFYFYFFERYFGNFVREHSCHKQFH